MFIMYFFPNWFTFCIDPGALRPLTSFITVSYCEFGKPASRRVPVMKWDGYVVRRWMKGSTEPQPLMFWLCENCRIPTCGRLLYDFLTHTHNHKPRFLSLSKKYVPFTSFVSPPDGLAIQWFLAFSQYNKCYWAPPTPLSVSRSKTLESSIKYSFSHPCFCRTIWWQRL